MIKVALIACSLFSVVGCNSGTGIGPVPSDEMPSMPTAPDDPQTGQAGSRLKRRIINAEDGSRQFVGWYDSEREENCSFRSGPDKKIRCMPSELVVELLGARNADLVVFTDAACETPVYASSGRTFDKCEKRPKYFFHSVSGESICESEYTVYSIGEQLGAASTESFFYRDPQGCMPIELIGTPTMFSATEHHPDEFVSATEQIID